MYGFYFRSSNCPIGIVLLSCHVSLRFAVLAVKCFGRGIWITEPEYATHYESYASFPEILDQHCASANIKVRLHFPWNSVTESNWSQLHYSGESHLRTAVLLVCILNTCSHNQDTLLGKSGPSLQHYFILVVMTEDCFSYADLVICIVKLHVFHV